MTGFSAIYRRELSALFLMPLAWVLLCIALPLLATVFVSSLEGFGGDVVRAFEFFYENLIYWGLMVFLAPLLTMRMISEEAKTGTLEYVLTAPVSDAAVVLAKLAAVTSFQALLWGSIFVFAAVTAATGTPVPWGTVFAGWVGSVLVSAYFSAVGLVASAATSTPLLAAMIALVANVVILALPYAGALARVPADHAIHALLLDWNVIDRFGGSFGIGVIDTAHIVFFLALTALFAFVATRLVESKRWL